MQATVKNAEQLKKCEDVCVSGLRAPREISLLALILNALVSEKYGETEIDERGRSEERVQPRRRGEEMRELTVRGIKR